MSIIINNRSSKDNQIWKSYRKIAIVALYGQWIRQTLKFYRTEVLKDLSCIRGYVKFFAVHNFAYLRNSLKAEDNLRKISVRLHMRACLAEVSGRFIKLMCIKVCICKYILISQKFQYFYSPVLTKSITKD